MKEKSAPPRNSVHSIMSVVPLSMLGLSCLFDVLYVITKNTALAEFTFYAIALGIAAGFATSILGVIDWIEIPQGTQAKRLGLWHGLGNGMVLFLFILSWFMRTSIPGATSLIIAFTALAMATLMAKLGNEISKALHPHPSPMENQH